jgi:hypothetical protein
VVLGQVVLTQPSKTEDAPHQVAQDPKIRAGNPTGKTRNRGFIL